MVLLCESEVDVLLSCFRREWEDRGLVRVPRDRGSRDGDSSSQRSRGDESRDRDRRDRDTESSRNRDSDRDRKNAD